MKSLAFAFLVLNAVSAYCGGFGQMNLVNEQEIPALNVNSIEILYRSEEITVLKSYTNSLVIKEYMNVDNSDYYADITNLGNKLTIRRGNRPWLNGFRARVEVHIPVSFMRDITIKTSSGRIVASDDYAFSRIIMQTSSGGISVNTLTAETVNITTTSGGIRCEKINGNTVVNTTSGSIRLGRVEGNISAETSSGAIRGESVNGNIIAKTTSGGIEFNSVTGSIEMRTTSGKIYCSAAEIAGNISLAATSGRIELVIPQHSIFNFTARRTSGNLSTPFQERLFTPVSERGLVQGTIGDGTPNNDIDIKTTSGSIVVKYR